MASDNFNRADVSPIGGNWSSPTGGGGFQITTNAVRGTTGGFNVTYYNAVVFANDHDSQCVISTIHDGGPAIRVSSSAFTFYAIETFSGTDTRFIKMVAGVQTTIGSGISGTYASGNLWRLVGVGTGLEMFYNGVSQGTRTDATIASGSSGLCDFGTAGSMDDWASTDPAAASAMKIINNHLRPRAFAPGIGR